MKRKNQKDKAKVKKIICLDMDGTLAKFYEHADCLERMYIKLFFLKLRAYWSIIKGLMMLFVKYNSCIEFYAVSAVNEAVEVQAIKEKRAWLKKYCPFIPEDHYIFMLVGQNKAETVRRYFQIDQNCILIDDYNQNLEDWQTAGGTAIKFVNEINDKGSIGPLWAGERIRYDFTPERITEELERILWS